MPVPNLLDRDGLTKLILGKYGKAHQRKNETHTWPITMVFAFDLERPLPSVNYYQGQPY